MTKNNKKEMKVFYMGKRVRDSKGRFYSIINNIKKLFRFSVRLGFVVLTLFSVYKLGQYYTPSEVIYQRVEADVQDTLKGKITTLKYEVVDAIQKCESQNNKDLIYTFDPDPRQPNKQIASFGQFQYKLKTIVDYQKMLYGVEITERQALDIALDEGKARDLTLDIVFKDNGKGVLNWFNCSKKHDLKTKVELIKELEK